MEDVVSLLLLLLGSHLPTPRTFGQFLLDQILLGLEAGEGGVLADYQPNLIVPLAAAARPDLRRGRNLRPVHQFPASVMAHSRRGVWTRADRGCEAPQRYAYESI